MVKKWACEATDAKVHNWLTEVYNTGFIAIFIYQHLIHPPCDTDLVSNDFHVFRR